MPLSRLISAFIALVFSINTTSAYGCGICDKKVSFSTVSAKCFLKAAPLLLEKAKKHPLEIVHVNLSECAKSPRSINDDIVTIREKARNVLLLYTLNASFVVCIREKLNDLNFESVVSIDINAECANE